MQLNQQSLTFSRQLPLCANTVEEAVTKLQQDLMHFSLPKQTAFTTGLCLAEILNNIIEHQGGDRQSAPITLQGLLNRQRLYLKVSHQAPAYKSKSSLTDPMAESGRGIALVEHLADYYHLAHKQGINVVTLNFYFFKPQQTKGLRMHHSNWHA